MSAACTPIYTVRLERAGSVAERPRASTPADAARIVRAFVPDDGREHFGVLLLDIRNRVTGVLEVSTGCMTGSLVHPREVFGPAIEHKAAGLILWHNHPSGDPEPSAEDLSLTRRLVAGGALLGIEILDHVILGDGGSAVVSLKERGLV